MSVQLEDNFQFSYQRLLYFLGRPGEKGYIFCRADDYRFIPKITTSLIQDLLAKGISAKEIYLRKNADEPLVHQIENAISGTDVLIVANLYEIVNQPETGLANLAQLNFARETLWQIGKPILFWADAQSMNILANRAPDLYSQRRNTTVHFTGVADIPVADMLQIDGWETFLSSSQFKDVETNINILEKRLYGAKESSYPVTRLISEIVLPLAKEYAQLGLTSQARRLINEYVIAPNTNYDEKILMQLAGVYHALHDYELAISTLKLANNLIKKQSADNNDSTFRNSWFVNLIHIAVWSDEVGRSEDILPELLEAITLLEQNNESGWNSRVLATIEYIVGNTLREIGQLQDAKRHYEISLQIREKVHRDNPNILELIGDIGSCYDKLGDIAFELNNLDEAKKYYQKALDVAEELFNNNPSSDRYNHHVFISLMKLGDVLCELRNYYEALDYYEKGLSIAQQLSINAPQSELFQRDKFIVSIKIGDVFRYLKDVKDATKYYKDALGIAQKLHKSNPHSEVLQRDLCVSLNNLGDITKDEVEAQGYYEKSLRISQYLIKNNPNSEQIQNDIAGALSNIGNLLSKKGEYEEAMKYYEESSSIAEKLFLANPYSQQLKNNYSRVKTAIAKINKNKF